MWKDKAGDDARATLDAELDYAHLLLLSGRVTESLDLVRGAYERSRRHHPSDSGLVQLGRRRVAAASLATGATDAAKALYGHRLLPSGIKVESVYQGSYEPESSGAKALMFWETWCPYCLVALPIMEQVQREFSERGLQVIGMSHDEGDSAEVQMHRLLQDRGVDYTVVKVNDYGDLSQGIPYMWILHDGELVWEGNPLNTRGMWKRVMPGLVAALDAGVELES